MFKDLLKPENLISIEDIGDKVVCDICNEDYTNSVECGGFIFGSKAYCPKCASEDYKNIVKYKEERFIKAVCPADVTFKDFILSVRNGNNTIKFFAEGGKKGIASNWLKEQIK